jgi:TANFOR domain-containing protein
MHFNSKDMKKLFFFFLFGATVARAQQVSVSVNVLPPYSAYLQDYASQAGKVRILVRNTTASAVDLRLEGSITGDNGVTIRTLANYRPVVPLHLAPMESRVLSQPDLEGLFDLNQISVEGMDKNQLYQGRPLPEGMYQLCLKAFDNRTTQLLSAEFPQGCSAPFIVRSVEPPVLILPVCDGQVPATTPQSVVFTWAPPVGVSPAQVEYTLRVVELPLDVDPNVYIDAVNLPNNGLEVTHLKTAGYFYKPGDPPLKAGKRYAYRVRAIDPTGKLVFLNDGKSPVCSFRYGAEVVAEKKKELPKPPAEARLDLFTFCGKAIQVTKLTDTRLDQYAGEGTLTLLEPFRMTVRVRFSGLTIRPTRFAEGQYPATQGFSGFEVVQGHLEEAIDASAYSQADAKLTTDPHTGGSAAMTCDAVRLDAQVPVEFNTERNAYDKKGGSEVAEIRSGVRWNSPILISEQVKVPKGAVNPRFSIASPTSLFSSVRVEVPAVWGPLSKGKTNESGELKISFGKRLTYEKLSDLPGFALTLEETSYFSISKGVLKVVLTGDLTIPCGRNDCPPMRVPFRERSGVAFTASVEDPLVVPLTDNASGFLRFSKLNIRLADLWQAEDLTYPEWVTGVALPEAAILVRTASSKTLPRNLTPGTSGSGTMPASGGMKPAVKASTIRPGVIQENTPSKQLSAEESEYITIPHFGLVNTGNGFATIRGDKNKTAIKTTFRGFKAKITSSTLTIRQSRLKGGSIQGALYIPVIGAIGDLYIAVTDDGLADGEVLRIQKGTRTLVDTPEGDQLTVELKSGKFEHDDALTCELRFFAGNKYKVNRGLLAWGIPVKKVGITADGRIQRTGLLVSAHSAYYSEEQLSAAYNGMDFHLKWADFYSSAKGSDDSCHFDVGGMIVLGEKIVSLGDESRLSFAFAKPADDFEFTAPFKQASPSVPPVVPNSKPTVPVNLKETKIPKGGGLEPVSAFEKLETAEYVMWRALPAPEMAQETNTIRAGADIGSLAFEGTFTSYLDDPDYGNGFRVKLNAEIREPFRQMATSTVVAGNKNGVKYWFLEVGTEGDLTTFPLFAGVEAYGFKGRFYHHMKHAGDQYDDIGKEDYIPHHGVSFGMYVSMPIRTMEGGYLLKGRVAAETVFKGFVPETMTIQGDAGILSTQADGGDARIKGRMRVNFDFLELSMSGTVDIQEANLTVLCGHGKAYFYLDKEANFVCSAGTPSEPIQANLFCGAGPLGNMTSISASATVFHTKEAMTGPLAFVPVGTGIRVHAQATLLSLDSRSMTGIDNPYLLVTVTANADFDLNIKDMSTKAEIGARLTATAGYSPFQRDLADVGVYVQMTAFDPLCIALRQKICFPGIGGPSFVIGIKNGAPVFEVFGEQKDMCFPSPNDPGACDGILNKIVDGALRLVNEAGELLEDIGETIVNIICLGFC